MVSKKSALSIVLFSSFRLFLAVLALTGVACQKSNSTQTASEPPAKATPRRPPQKEFSELTLAEKIERKYYRLSMKCNLDVLDTTMSDGRKQHLITHRETIPLLSVDLKKTDLYNYEVPYEGTSGRISYKGVLRLSMGFLDRKNSTIEGANGPETYELKNAPIFVGRNLINVRVTVGPKDSNYIEMSEQADHDNISIDEISSVGVTHLSTHPTENPRLESKVDLNCELSGGRNHDFKDDIRRIN